MQKISINRISSGMILAKNIYTVDGILLLSEGTLLTERHKAHLNHYKIPAVFIKSKYDVDFDTEEIISEKVRVEANASIQKCFKKYSLTQKVDSKAALETVEKILAEVLKNKDIVIELTDVKTYDDYTFQHSTNVCAMSALMGVALNYSADKLKTLAMGALLHDLGKMTIPKELLNKPSKLTEEEMQCMQSHSEMGFEILRKKNIISTLVAHIALSHHEKFDGSGYPRGIAGTEIHEFARIVSICDVYDALISDRPYRRGMNPSQAYEILLSESGTRFDPAILKVFLQRISIYPVGCFVELSSGEIAIVSKVYKGIPWRPCVTPILAGNGAQISDRIEIDLTTKLDLTIIRVLDEAEYIKFII